MILNPVTRRRTAPWGAQFQLKEVMTQSQWHGRSRVPPPLPSVGEWGSGYLTLGERKGPGQPLKPGYGGRGMSDTEVFYA